MLTFLRLLLVDEKLRRLFCPLTFELYWTTSTERIDSAIAKPVLSW